MDAYSRPAVHFITRKPDSLEKLKLAARKLFAQNGYDETRPQDITREAGLGHGTFYLHYENKRACFLAFVDDARAELWQRFRLVISPGLSPEEIISRTLQEIYAYSDEHPGVLRAALADEVLIGSERTGSLIQQWGREWAALLRECSSATLETDADIEGQAIAGAIFHCTLDGALSRQQVLERLPCFLSQPMVDKRNQNYSY